MMRMADLSGRMTGFFSLPSSSAREQARNQSAPGLPDAAPAFLFGESSRPKTSSARDLDPFFLSLSALEPLPPVRRRGSGPMLRVARRSDA